MPHWLQTRPLPKAIILISRDPKHRLLERRLPESLGWKLPTAHLWPIRTVLAAGYFTSKLDACGVRGELSAVVDGCGIVADGLVGAGAFEEEPPVGFVELPLHF